MKRIFMGILYLLLLVMTFVYVLIYCVDTTSNGETAKYAIISASAFTGLSVIGFIFTIPAIVFTILSLTIDKLLQKFLRDMFAFFASVFSLAAAIVTVIKYHDSITNYFVPVILMVCTVVLLVISLVGVINAIHKDQENKKKLESNENVEVLQ